jgi:hypothetical protein
MAWADNFVVFNVLVEPVSSTPRLQHRAALPCTESSEGSAHLSF